MTIEVLATYRPTWASGNGRGGARACGHDEDALTLAVAALRPVVESGRDVRRVALVTREPAMLAGDTAEVLTTALELDGVPIEQHLGGGPAVLEPLVGSAPGAAVVAVPSDAPPGSPPVQRKPAPGGTPDAPPVVPKYEMPGVEALGLLKMDFLGRRTLDFIPDTGDLIGKPGGPRLDIDHVPLDDEPTFELLRRADSVGVFQLEGGPMRTLMRSLTPTSFDDVAALVALYRPGPMAANMHNDYADRKNGRKPIAYAHPDLEPILADTQGLMIYQESVMRVAQKFAGYSLEEADNLRKACLPRGTRLLTEARGYVPIEQLMSLANRRVQTIDTTSANSRFAEVDDVWSVGMKPVSRLTTSTGYTVEATADHRFLVEDRWKRLEDIAAGDLVAVASRTTTDGGSRVSDAEVDLAALLISEGYTPDLVGGPRRVPHFCHTDPELADAFLRAFARHFGYENTRVAEVAGVTRACLTSEELVSLRPLLGSLGLSADKTIPARLLNSSKRKVERFLGRYFCADGWADRSGAHFGSKSRDVCVALKRMLLRFGILSDLHRRQVAGHGTHYTLSIADKAQAKAFAQLVGPHLTEIKATKVARWLTEWGAGASTIGMPASFVASELGKSTQQLGVDSSGDTSVRVLHRATLDGLLCSERLEDLRTGDLVWDTVVAVEPAGVRECFDFQMADPDRPYALAEDVLVHNCGKKIRALIAAEREKFVKGCVDQGYGEQLGTQLFDVIEPFADYAFNKSHSYGYGLVAYQTAWLKAHHPVEYMAALLTSVKDNKDKTAVYLAECRALGIEVLVPDVNRSAAEFGPRRGEDRPGILFGLAAVRNVGESLVERIVAEREAGGPFADIYDFCRRVDPVVLNKRTMESLAKAGAYDSLGHPRQGLCLVMDDIVDRTLERRREHEVGIATLFSSLEPAEGDDDARWEGTRVPVPDLEFDKSQKLAFEKEMLGLYVSDHPLLGLEQALARHTDCPLAEVRDGAGEAEGVVRAVGGVVTDLRRQYTKKGDLMARFVLEDLQASMEVFVFPKVMAEHGALLENDAVAVVRGRVDLRDEQPKLVAMEIRRPELGAPGAQALRIALPLSDLTDEKVGRLKQLLGEHPGTSPVLLHVGEKVLRLPPEFNVDSRNGLVGELKWLLGAGGVVA